MNRLGRAMADGTRSRILLSLLEKHGYPAQLARDLELTDAVLMVDESQPCVDDCCAPAPAKGKA